MNRQRIAGVIAAGLLAIGTIGPVAAAEPFNDDITAAAPIGLPSTTNQSTVEATSGATDSGACAAGGHSVWFSFAAGADGLVQISTAGSNFDTVVVVGTSDGAGGIDVIDCNDDDFGLQSRVRFDAVAGTTYLIMVASYLDSAGGDLWLSLAEAPPPPTMELTIDRTGSFDAYGAATIRGTIACSAGAGLSQLDVSLTQRVGRFVLRGFGGGKALECGPDPVAWEASVVSDDGKFLGGATEARVFGYVCGEFECVEQELEATVRLRR